MADGAVVENEEELTAEAAKNREGRRETQALLGDLGIFQRSLR